MTAHWLLLPLLLQASPPGSTASGEVEPSGYEIKLWPDDGEMSDNFGAALSISGRTALVGAPNEGEKGQFAGAAYVFVEHRGGWLQQAKLLPSQVEAFDRLGESVALDGDTALIAAPGDDGVTGAAYVFVRDGARWTEQAKLVPTGARPGDEFGASVALHGNVALIGADLDDDNGIDAGAAYVFVRRADGWVEVDKLFATDGEPDDRFGESVSVFGDKALVGAPQDQDNGLFSGSAYVFDGAGGVWVEAAKLLASDGGPSDYFGGSVSLDGDTALVGAVQVGLLTTGRGAAYVFRRSGGHWTGEGTLRADDGDYADMFGSSVVVRGDVALVGAVGHAHMGGTGTGAAYRFERHLGHWRLRSELLATDREPVDFFGGAISIEAGHTLIGAHNEDQNGPGSGSAYVFGPGTLELGVEGECRGLVSVEVTGAPPGSEVVLMNSHTASGWAKRGGFCRGAVFEIDPQSPTPRPLILLRVDDSGTASGEVEVFRCLIEAISVAQCTTSPVVSLVDR